MRTLLLLRHAKSSWKEADLRDHERPLNKRGRKTAQLMGEFLAANGHLPDLIINSPAVRARETAELVIERSGFDARHEIAEPLYPTTIIRCLYLLAEMGAEAESVMIIAHNPGLEELVVHLTGSFEVMPTCALAEIQLPIDGWPDLTADTIGTLVNLYRPRELFPE